MRTTAERVRALPVDEEEGLQPSSSSPIVEAGAASGGLLDVGEVGGSPAGASVLVGTYFHSMDEKGRVIVPAKLRAGLTDQFWMMLDERDNVGIYPYATGMDILEHCERMIAEHPDDEDIAAAVMRITEAADLVVVESTFRVLVPDLLRYHSGLHKEVVTQGALNHVVLWDRSRWEEWKTDNPLSVEVRKVQGALMRSAASGARQREEQDEARRRAEEAALERDLERANERALDRDAGRAAQRAGRKAASSSDGGRVPGVLKMSDLGRTA